MYETFLEVTKDLGVYDSMALYLVEQGEDGGPAAVLKLQKGLIYWSTDGERPWKSDKLASKAAGV